MPESKKIYSDVNNVSVYSWIKNSTEADTKGYHYSIHYTENDKRITTSISFQRGSVKEVGVTGITSETLLAILIDRTQVLDERLPCTENKLALQHLQRALQAFNDRTKDRQSRGVEGFNKA